MHVKTDFSKYKGTPLQRIKQAITEHEDTADLARESLGEAFHLMHTQAAATLREVAALLEPPT